MHMPPVPSLPPPAPSQPASLASVGLQVALCTNTKSDGRWRRRCARERNQAAVPARSLLHRRLAARVAAAALLLLALGAAALRLHAALGGRGRLLLLDGCRAGGRQGAEVG